MKYYRFMGETEYAKLMAGETLKSNKDWSKTCRTNSVGFCFLRYDDFTPEEALLFIKGIVDNAHCVIFETEETLREGYGCYANPYSNPYSLELETIIVAEYSIKEYNCNKMKPILDGYEVDFDKIEWRKVSSNYDYWEDKYGDLT